MVWSQGLIDTEGSEESLADIMEQATTLPDKDWCGSIEVESESTTYQTWLLADPEAVVSPDPKQSPE